MGENVITTTKKLERATEKEAEQTKRGIMQMGVRG